MKAASSFFFQKYLCWFVPFLGHTFHRLTDKQATEHAFFSLFFICCCYSKSSGDNERRTSLSAAETHDMSAGVTVNSPLFEESRILFGSAIVINPLSKQVASIARLSWFFQFCTTTFRHITVYFFTRARTFLNLLSMNHPKKHEFYFVPQGRGSKENVVSPRHIFFAPQLAISSERQHCDLSHISFANFRVVWESTLTSNDEILNPSFPTRSVSSSPKQKEVNETRHSEVLQLNPKRRWMKDG